MFNQTSELDVLCDRVRRGEAEAGGALRQALGRDMEIIVRRALRRGRGELADRIRALSAALGRTENGPDADARAHVRQVAERVCDDLVSGLRMGAASDHRALETVVV